MYKQLIAVAGACLVIAVAALVVASRAVGQEVAAPGQYALHMTLDLNPKTSDVGSSSGENGVETVTVTAQPLYSRESPRHSDVEAHVSQGAGPTTTDYQRVIRIRGIDVMTQTTVTDPHSITNYHGPSYDHERPHLGILLRSPDPPAASPGTPPEEPQW
jgi:hypothetical protein